jgi:hypothetical protein
MMKLATSQQMKGMTMEIDHESTNKELAVRILGLIHTINLLEEFGEPPFETYEELKHAAFTVSERLALEIDV